MLQCLVITVLRVDVLMEYIPKHYAKMPHYHIIEHRLFIGRYLKYQYFNQCWLIQKYFCSKANWKFVQPFSCTGSLTGFNPFIPKMKT